ncbi:MAG: hypothetical protein WBX29_02590 [Nitrososphaeraceae archaeon]
MRRNIFGADGVGIGLVDVYRTQTSTTLREVCKNYRKRSLIL